MGFGHLIFFSLLFVLLLPILGSSSDDPLNGPPINVSKQLSYPDFGPRAHQDLKLLGSASFNGSQSSIQVPGDFDSDDLRHQAGRVIYSSPLRLFDPRSRTPASFQTTFSFQINNVTPTQFDSGGSGLTFIIVPDEFTVGRPGPWLAMLNDACDQEYKAVAVEFDTRMNPEFGDPNDNHVGINLGSIVSSKTFDASDVGVSLNDGSVHRAWIGYDGPRRWMEIRLGSEAEYPSKPVFSGTLDLSPYLKEYMFVGFSASTGNHTQIHRVMSWNFTSTSQAYLRVPSIETCESKITVDASGVTPRSDPPTSYLIFAAVVALALIVLFIFYYTSWRRRNDQSRITVLPEKKGRPRPPNKPRRFSISEVFTATRFFSETEILGRDSMGVFYRGKLPNGSQLAVKRLSAEFLSSNGLDRKRVLKEIGAMSRIRHPNLVPIRGWCQDNRETIVVYEFCPNGSLDKWLFGVGALPWTRRFKVVRDVAESLSFLHSKELAHKNMKTTSVFLDVSFRAALGDFGFVLAGNESKRFEAAVSQKADVFEFGVFALEVVAGRKRTKAEAAAEERELVEYAWRLHENEERLKVVDGRMGAVVNLEQVGRVVEIALLCTLNENKGRPTMEEVVEMLSSERPVPELPPCRPVSLFPYSSTTGLCTGYACHPFK